MAAQLYNIGRPLGMVGIEDYEILGDPSAVFPRHQWSVGDASAIALRETGFRDPKTAQVFWDAMSAAPIPGLNIAPLEQSIRCCANDSIKALLRDTLWKTPEMAARYRMSDSLLAEPPIDHYKLFYKMHETTIARSIWDFQETKLHQQVAVGIGCAVRSCLPSVRFELLARMRHLIGPLIPDDMMPSADTIQFITEQMRQLPEMQFHTRAYLDQQQLLNMIKVDSTPRILHPIFGTHYTSPNGGVMSRLRGICPQIYVEHGATGAGYTLVLDWAAGRPGKQLVIPVTRMIRDFIYITAIFWVLYVIASEIEEIYGPSSIVIHIRKMIFHPHLMVQDLIEEISHFVPSGGQIEFPKLPLKISGIYTVEP